MIDFLGEMGTVMPYLYRGWAFLLSGRYRRGVLADWRRWPVWRRSLDAAFSVAFMAAEAVFAIAVLSNVT